MKEKFIKSTFILLLGGLITKVLGLIIRMVMGRLLGSKGMGLYMIILPTFSLFVGISQFGLPVALAKLVAEDKKDNKKLFISAFFISIIINLLLIIFILAFGKDISFKLLKNKDSYLGIMAIGIVLPFISISSICRSYFFGKEKMFPHVLSNVIEDVFRLIIFIIGIPFFMKKGLSYTVCFLILSNVLCEIISIFILILFLPKVFIVDFSSLKPDRSYMKETLSIGIPNTCSRLIGSIGYFLEPILLTYVLRNIGYSNNYILNEYGVLTGFVLPILLLPSFFTNAISNALLPVISKEYSKNNLKNVKKSLYLSIILSLSIGIFFMLLFLIKAKFILNTIYKTNQGINYLRVLAPICILQYLQAPIAISLQGMNKFKTILFSNILGILVRCIGLVLFSLFKIGLWGLIIGISLNVLVITIYQIIVLRKTIKNSSL